MISSRCSLFVVRNPISSLSPSPLITPSHYTPPPFLYLSTQFAGAHIYFFTHILHDWPDESCRQILLNTIPALTPHSKIVIVDIVVPETGAQPFTCMMDISMMAYGGCERTEKQWRALLGSVGLRIVGVEGPREGSLTGDSVLEVVCGEGSGDGEV